MWKYWNCNRHMGLIIWQKHSVHMWSTIIKFVKLTKVIRNSNGRDEELHVELRRIGSKGRPSEAGRQRQPSGRGEGGGQADKYFSQADTSISSQTQANISPKVGKYFSAIA